MINLNQNQIIIVVMIIVINIFLCDIKFNYSIMIIMLEKLIKLIFFSKLINLKYFINVYNYINNSIRYLFPVSTIYKMKIDDKNILVKQVNIIKYFYMLNEYTNYGNYLYISDINLDNIKSNYKIYKPNNLEINFIKVILLTNHNTKYELMLENDLTNKVGQYLFIKLINRAINSSKIYLLIYYYLKYYLNNNDRIYSIIINIDKEIITSNINIYDTMTLEELYNI